MRQIVLVVILLNVLHLPLYSQPHEYIIKGVLLEKFTRFIDWPENSGISDTSQPFIIGIIGKDPFDYQLSELYSKRSIKKKNVIVKHLESVNKIDTCHLLFISNSEYYRFSRIISEIEKKPVLTISDNEKFSGRGTIINLKIENNKIRFEIDESAAHKSGLYLSHLLLKEAEIINPVR